MKKRWIFLTVLVLLLGLGSGVYAATTDNPSFYERMFPFMKQMHPDFTDEQLQDMYKDCSTHSQSGEHPMMDDSLDHGRMMDF